MYVYVYTQAQTFIYMSPSDTESKWMCRDGETEGVQVQSRLIDTNLQVILNILIE